MPKSKTAKATKTNRAKPEARSKEAHDKRTGQAKAGAGEIKKARNSGTTTTAPRSMNKATRDRSENKKVQSGR